MASEPSSTAGSSLAGAGPVHTGFKITAPAVHPLAVGSRGQRRGAGPWRRMLRAVGNWTWVAVLLGLGLLTLWHAIRSPALVEAQAALEGRDPGAWKPDWLHNLETAVDRWRRGEVGRRQPPRPHPPGPNETLALQRALDQLASRPRDSEAARLAALCLSRLGYASQAEPYYALAKQRRRLSLSDMHSRAMGLAKGNLRDQAIAAYQEILRRYPDEPESLQRLAAILYSQSRYKETLAVAERLSRLPEKKWAVAGYALMGIVHHDEHRPGEAVAANEKVLELDPSLELLTLPTDLFIADLAQDLVDIGRAADARRQILRILGTRDEPVLIDILGSAHYADGQEDEAEQCWQRAAEINPRYHRPWLNLGKLALRRGRFTEALPYLEKAHSLDRSIYEPAYQLSLTYRRLGRLEDAESFRRLAETLRPKDPFASPGMGPPPDEKP